MVKEGFSSGQAMLVVKWEQQWVRSGEVMLKCCRLKVDLLLFIFQVCAVKHSLCMSSGSGSCILCSSASMDSNMHDEEVGHHEPSEGASLAPMSSSSSALQVGDSSSSHSSLAVLSCAGGDVVPPGGGIVPPGGDIAPPGGNIVPHGDIVPHLPPSGYVSGNGIKTVQVEFPGAPPLQIKLVQAAEVELLSPATQQRHSSGLISVGMEPTIHYYGTVRGASTTHFAARFLTRRNQRDLPACLYFDPTFIESCAQHCLCREAMRTVSPAFGEWLMGLPRGWTDLEACKVPRQHPVCLWPRRSRRWRTLSLFSGIGALDWGLSAFCQTVAFVEKSAAATAVLQKRIRDGLLEECPVFSDVRTVSVASLGTPIDGIIAGFPCTGTSRAGVQAGLGNMETALVDEVFRLAGETRCLFIFLENVANLCSMPHVWQPLLQSLHTMGFGVSWTTVQARHVGIPCRRARWFCLAVRRGWEGGLVADPLDATRALEDWLWPTCSKPPPHEFMVTDRGASERLRLCGLSVVPMQAFLAARVLSSDPFPPHAA